jgi:hypothetical protein
MGILGVPSFLFEIKAASLRSTEVRLSPNSALGKPERDG